MFGFGKKKEVNSEEYEKLLKKLAEMQSNIEVLHGKYKVLETVCDNLRGILNRKLSGIAKEISKDSNNSDTSIPGEGVGDSKQETLNITPGIIPMKW